MALENEPNSDGFQDPIIKTESEPISDFVDLSAISDESPNAPTQQAAEPQAGSPASSADVPVHLAATAAMLGLTPQVVDALHGSGQLESFLMQQQMARYGQMPTGMPGAPMPGMPMPMQGMPMNPMGMPGMIPQQPGYSGMQMQPGYNQQLPPDDSPKVPDFRVADDLSNVGEVIGQVNSYYQNQMQEMQAVMGSMYENMQQMQQQMQSAWLSEKIGGLGDGWTEVFGDPRQPVAPYSPQAFARSQVMQAVESMSQYNPMLTKDQVFDMVVRSQWSNRFNNRQSDQATKPRSPVVGRPNASKSTKDPFSVVAEKMHNYRTQNGEY